MARTLNHEGREIGTTTVAVIEDPRAGIEAAIEGARLADPILRLLDGRTFALTPDKHRLQDITDPHRLPPRQIQRVTLDNRRSLSDYANRFSTAASILIADYDAMTIAAHLDFHRSNQDDEEGILLPGACKHTATFKLLPSEEFQRWDAMEGDFHPQAEFAAFLEENSVDISMPEATVMVEISRDLEATVDQSFKSSVRLENGDRKFRFETDTRVANDVVVPREFFLNIPLYNGEPPVELRAAFRFRPTAQGLLLAFEWRRVEYQRRATFAEIAATAAEETGLPFFMGRTA
ncbi:DUF2303 family protein [Falsirhodobacter halotolerans]|uniref:DUF2303 family protein n=1 Tax=Falsirhodobacter halotolerans TaxID=1146892 RepID=UPI001FD2FFF9|nr:DUF2303 family protein [Falsirhodobacter halotolerans]MCJ8138410.1 YfdQ family protein [Falsirhodobacter halotolerans]